MNFIDLVNQRESVRKYSDKKIERDLISKCLEAARLAPSACNSQPWTFLVIDNKETVKELVKCSMSGVYSMNKFAEDAPVLIIVITEKSLYSARLGGLLRSTKYSLIDIGIVCDHLTLQAAELGLGTCMIGWFNEKNLKKTLSLPKNKKIDLVISMGYKANNLETRKKKRKSLDEISKYL